jgi:hypothetical protein
MSRVEPGMLWKKTAKKAALSSGNVVSGAVFLAASAALWNPLPLILWGLGAASYVLYSTTSDKHLRKVVEEERAQDEASAEAQREGQRRTVELLLDGPPFSTWTFRTTAGSTAAWSRYATPSPGSPTSAKRWSSPPRWGSRGSSTTCSARSSSS